MKRWLLTLVWLCLSIPAFAQVTTTSKLTWDQQAATVDEANGYTYRYYPDGQASVLLTNVVCSGTTPPFVCVAPFPAFTPGTHTLTATAGNTAGESVKSNPLAFTFVVIPTPPANLRIQ